MWLVATVLDSVGYKELQPIEVANQEFTAFHKKIIIKLREKHTNRNLYCAIYVSV